MQVITSKDNEMVKQIRKLKEKKYRDETGCFMVEGIKLVEEALQEKVKIQTIVICEECMQDGSLSQSLLYEIAKQNCLYVSAKVFDILTDVTNPQGILAVVYKMGEEEKTESKQVAELFERGEKAEIENKQRESPKKQEEMIVALDGIQDPGNLGTILRTLDSAGMHQILLSKDTVDPYNPKVVRSTMGAIYRVQIKQVENLVEELKKYQKQGHEVMVTSLQAEKNIYQVDYHKKIVVIGNEANGVSKEIEVLADEKIKIPMLGKAESLNAAVATSIIVYEYIRREHFAI